MLLTPCFVSVQNNFDSYLVLWLFFRSDEAQLMSADVSAALFFWLALQCTHVRNFIMVFSAVCHLDVHCVDELLL